MGVHEAVAFLNSRGLIPPLEESVQVRIGIPAYARRTSTTCPLALERAASSLPGNVTVHPKYSDMDTAAGIALLAHELVHQGQFETMPDFDAEYEAESRYVDEWGLPPYENALERPAYEREVEAYLAALEAGYPPGEHTPLLIHDGVAAEGFVSGVGRGFAVGVGFGIAGLIFALAKAGK